MIQLQREPSSVEELQDSYDRLYESWMGEHQNIDQAKMMLDLLEVKPNRRIADIGCGTGYVLAMARERGLKAFGVDISSVALRKAKSQVKEPVRVILAESENLPWPEGSFDYVIILGSLEHFLDPSQAIREVDRILTAGGQAAILVPNSHHLRAIYNVYKYGEILSDLQEFERFATRAEWARLIEQNGLRVLSVHPYDTGWARVYKPGRTIFWTLYNLLFRVFGSRWIPFNLAYTFIFRCESAGNQPEKTVQSTEEPRSG